MMDSLHSGMLLLSAGLTSSSGGLAKKNGKTEAVTLLERFKSDAAKTRSEVRRELGITGQYYSYYYYSIIFLFSSFFILGS